MSAKGEKVFSGTLNSDEIVKTIFSRKGAKNAKNAKKITININKLTLRALRLCVRFFAFCKFIEYSKIENRNPHFT